MSNVWEKIIDLAITNGIWAVMFLGLLIYLIKDSRTREAKYQDTIKNLSNSLNVVYEMQEDIVEIKETIKQNDKKVDYNERET